MSGRWSAARATEWHARAPWLVGCNYIPSTAINQIEMWSAGSFDPVTIARELGWARDLGFNTARVYLHDLCWTEDEAGFFARLDTFLSIASASGIRPLLVLFDDCWHEPAPGEQPAPRHGIHNSGWARSPGREVLLRPADGTGWKPT